MLENANLTGLQDTVVETGTFLETRLAMVESQIAYCGTQLTQQVKTPSTVTTDAAIQTKLQEAVFHAACQVDIMVTSHHELVPQLEVLEERNSTTALEAHPEWAGGEGEVDTPAVMNDSEVIYPSSTLPMPEDAYGHKNTFNEGHVLVDTAAQVMPSEGTAMGAHNADLDQEAARFFTEVLSRHYLLADTPKANPQTIFEKVQKLVKASSWEPDILRAMISSWAGETDEARGRLAMVMAPQLEATINHWDEEASSSGI